MHIPWQKVEALALEFTPILLSGTKYANLATYVASGVTMAQQAHEDAQAKGTPLTHEDLLKLALAEIHNGVEATNSTAGRELLNEPEIDQVLAHTVNAVVSVINTKTDVEQVINTAKAAPAEAPAPAAEPTA